MTRLRLAGAAALGAAAALTLTAAQKPSIFAQTVGGLWEVSGIPGSKTPLRQCVTDVARLAYFEHRNQSCSMRVITDDRTAATLEYNCGGSGFGHSRIDMITPRSLRIDTQGISDKLPFSYVLQARRVGDCPTAAAAPRH